MSVMILAHPRSKSTLMADCFNLYYGEIFNINIINKKTFKIDADATIDQTPTYILWKQEWAQEYLKYVETLFLKSSDFAFKVFYEHIFYSEQAQDLIARINPTIISIHRTNELAAIKSNLIARKRGFTKLNEVKISKFTVEPKQFFESYLICVVFPKLAQQIYKPIWSTTYENFDINNFPYLQKTPVILSQNSEDIFNYIINEEDVNTWYQALKN